MSKFNWLHICDGHFTPGSDDSYRLDKTLKALLETIEEGECFQVEMIFFAGDLADKAQDYKKAISFFDDLLIKTKMTERFGEKEAKRRLFIVPGNHDVERKCTKMTKRTLDNQDESDIFFGPNYAKEMRGPIFERFGGFCDFFNEYFKDIREITAERHFYTEVISFGSGDNKVSIGITGLNSALFSQDDFDRDKLWVGERVCQDSLGEIKSCDLKIVLQHHPISWLHPEEKRAIQGYVFDLADVLLHGHIHEDETSAIENQNGNALVFQAGALYAGSKHPRKLLIGRVNVKDRNVIIEPYKYYENPPARWKIDPGLFTTEKNHCKLFSFGKPIITTSNKNPDPGGGVAGLEELPEITTSGIIHNYDYDIGQYERGLTDSFHGVSGALDSIDKLQKSSGFLHGGKSRLRRFQLGSSADTSLNWFFLKEHVRNKPLMFAKNIVYEVVQEGLEETLPESPIQYLSELTSFAQVRKYGFRNKKTDDFINKEFNPDKSYLFISPPKTGKSTLLRLLACVVTDKEVEAKREYVFVRIWQKDKRASVSLNELLDIINSTKQTYKKTPVLLVDNIKSYQGLHYILAELRKQPGEIGQTPIWATELTDNMLNDDDGHWSKLEKCFLLTHDLPGVLHTSQNKDIGEFLKRVEETLGEAIMKIYKKTLKKESHVTPLYLGKLWEECKGLDYNLEILKDKMLRIPYVSTEIFKGIYGEQIGVGKSAINIACYLSGISREFLAEVTNSVNGMNCQEEVDKLFSGSVLRELGNVGIIKKNKGVQYVDGIQDVALLIRNFPPARRKDVLMCLLEIDSDSESFSEAIAHLDKHFEELDQSSRMIFFDKILNAPNTDESLLIASRHINDYPKLLSLWEVALKLAKDKSIWAEILSGFGLALLKTKRGKDALKCFNKAAKISPDDYRLQLNVAKAYEECLMWPQAYKHYSAILANVSDKREVVSGFYKSAMKNVSVDNLRNQLKTLSNAHPQSVWLADYLGFAWGANEPKDWVEAVKWHEKAVDLMPNEREFINGFYFALNKSEGIDRLRQRLAEKATENPQSAWLAVYAGFAWKANEPKDFSEALKWYDKAVELMPNEKDIINEFYYYFKESEGVDKLRHRFAGKAAAHPQSAWLASYAGLAWGANEPKDWGEAVKWHEKAVDLMPNEKDIINGFYFALKDSEGVDKLRQRLAGKAVVHPQSAWLADYTGFAWEANEPKGLSEAVKWHEKAVDLMPNENGIINGFYFALKKSEDVDKLRQRLAGKANAHPQSAWLASYAGLAWRANEPKDCDEAVKWYEKAVDLMPNENGIINGLYFALEESEGVDKLRQRLAEKANAHPQSAWLADYAGFAWDGNEPKDFSEALKWYDKAVELMPNEKEIINDFYFALKDSEGVDKLRQRLEGKAAAHPQSAWLADYTGNAWGANEPKGLSEAVKWHEKAVDLMPNEKGIVGNLCFALKEAEGVDETRKKFWKLSEKYHKSNTFTMNLADSYWHDKPRKPEEALNIYKLLVGQLQGEGKLKAFIRKTWCEWELGEKLDSSGIVGVLRREINLLKKEDTSSLFRELAEVSLALSKPNDVRKFLKKGQEFDAVGRWSSVDPVICAAACLVDGDVEGMRDSLKQFLSVVDADPKNKLTGWRWTELRRWLKGIDSKGRALLLLALDVCDKKESIENLRSKLED